MRTFPPAASALATLLALTACAQEPQPEDDTGLSEQDAAVDADAPSEETAPEPVILDLEETHTWDDGLSVALSEFERFNEADLGYPGDLDYVAFTVTFTNGSEAPVEFDQMARSCTVGGVEGDYEAFDHLAYEFPKMIQPGAEGVWQPACEMPAEESELQFMVQPGDPAVYPEVYFSGPVD
ncbi:hypothetical protein [Nocardiopsis sp. FR26]|uniref:hypothetical protein n=1 Tax=Nocardiopsis sp. FR26 TaxID=2605987 RepID=UPI001357A95B|nr:hypothetical protein [Nocardiopsis sp. FR26]